MVPGLPELWSETTGDPRVVASVLDGPVGRGHRSLSGARLNMIEAAASVAPDPNVPATRHGTVVASLIFGRHEPDGPGTSPPTSGYSDRWNDQFPWGVYGETRGEMGPCANSPSMDLRRMDPPELFVLRPALGEPVTDAAAEGVDQVPAGVLRVGGRAEPFAAAAGITTSGDAGPGPTNAAPVADQLGKIGAVEIGRHGPALFVEIEATNLIRCN